MSLGTLGKKLQRDLKANPKKGLLLLLMVCGAGYFWGPILKRWVGGKSGTAGAVAAAPVILDDPKPAEAVAGKFKPPSWEKLQEFLHKDRLTKPAELSAESRDPFAIAKVFTTEQSETKPVEETKPAVAVRNPLVKASPNVTADSGTEPEEVDLKVTSVSIGPRGRLAAIAGELVREGEMYEPDLGEAKSEEKVIFFVRRIEPWGVLLEFGGKDYKALLPQPQVSKKQRVVRENFENDN